MLHSVKDTCNLGHIYKKDQFKGSYLWYISTNSFPFHHKLSQEHIYLTSESKMRSHLAEEVLNGEMLHLMKLYQDSLGEAGRKFDGTVEILTHTSALIIFLETLLGLIDQSLKSLMTD